MRISITGPSIFRVEDLGVTVLLLFHLSMAIRTLPMNTICLALTSRSTSLRFQQKLRPKPRSFTVKQRREKP
jgi:succinate dehydrogenase/fumarate reductase cytochrome b subunit